MSISQSTIKFINSLQRKKFRQSYHKFTVEGTKIVGELLLQKRYRVSELYATEDWFVANSIDPAQFVALEGGRKQALDDGANYPKEWSQRPKLHQINAADLKRISSLTTPNQVLAVVDKPVTDELATSLVQIQKSWSLYLDGLQQPANLGAILRVADWFGFNQVIAGPGTVDIYNPKSIQATMGCFLRLNYFEATLTDVRAKCPNLPIYAADLSGKDIRHFEPTERGLLVIGNEGKGLRATTREAVSEYLMIPKGAGQEAESLNAAVAAGVLCSWLKR